MPKLEYGTTLRIKTIRRLLIQHLISFGLGKKAMELGKILKPLWKEGSLPEAPSAIQNDMKNPLDLTGWSKSLQGVPVFTVTQMTDYHTKVNNTFVEKAKTIKKHFARGEQFVEEKYIDTSTIYVKQDNNIFCIKGIAAASLKKMNRWVFIVLNKINGEVVFAHCQCPAGKTGTCSHCYAVMKLLAKWVVDELRMIPEPKACTSMPCVWNVPQAREYMQKPPVSELTIKSPDSKRNATNTEGASKKGITSSLYEPRSEHNRDTRSDSLRILLDNVTNFHGKAHAPKIMNTNPQLYTQTQFGPVPFGSILSYQCALMPPDFKVYCNIKEDGNKGDQVLFSDFTDHFFKQNDNVIDNYANEIHLVEQKKLMLLQNLKEQAADAISIEKNTRDQANNPNWFKYRENRFTASLCNKLGNSGPKTERGLKTLARNIVHGCVPQQFLKVKFEYGRYHEPIAIAHYERYMKIAGFQVVVENNGLTIDQNNYVLGATPDGRVNCNGFYGILEVKCSHLYRDIYPKLVCSVAKNPCILYDSNTENIKINKDHTYYNQIQMQLAITCQTWCDFIFYTSKGLVIDRVPFDMKYWQELQKNILRFYFTYMLPQIIEKDPDKLM
ncbi:uncharacterized protein LOC130622600 [Hydractinia symbiolongicarpus]|uniref:uncharacterized protein LOC130622600 n=1 Tax=Hydractinia symbiolongicarpus TaxID=13093 RepID=UPI00254EA19B|nr:uncharacterized protein LOC130622600 [Hydractinia symbiolongicarpus]